MKANKQLLCLYGTTLTLTITTLFLPASEKTNLSKDLLKKNLPNLPKIITEQNTTVQPSPASPWTPYTPTQSEPPLPAKDRWPAFLTNCGIKLVTSELINEHKKDRSYFPNLLKTAGSDAEAIFSPYYRMPDKAPEKMAYYQQRTSVIPTSIVPGTLAVAVIYKDTLLVIPHEKNLSEGIEEIQELPLTSTPHLLSWSPREKLLAFAYGTTFSILSKKKKHLFSESFDLKGEIKEITWSPDEKLLLFYTVNNKLGTLYLCNLKTEKTFFITSTTIEEPIEIDSFDTEDDGISKIDFSNSCKTILLTTHFNKIKMFNAATGKPLE